MEADEVRRFRAIVLEIVRRRGNSDGSCGDGSLIVGSGLEAGIEKDRRIVVIDLAGSAGRGDVDGDGFDQVGSGAAVTDDFFFLELGHGIEAFAVGGGDLQAEEQRVGPFGGR